MVSKRRLLEVLVSLHDRHGRSYTAEQLADELGVDTSETRETIESLHSYELVKCPGGRPAYVPTITARELLELDVDDDGFLIVEIPEEEPSDA